MKDVGTWERSRQWEQKVAPSVLVVFTHSSPGSIPPPPPPLVPLLHSLFRSASSPSLSPSQVTLCLTSLSPNVSTSSSLSRSLGLNLSAAPSPFIYVSAWFCLSSALQLSSVSTTVFPSSNLAAQSVAAVQNRQRGLPTTSPPLIQIDAGSHGVKVIAHHSPVVLLKWNEAENYSFFVLEVASCIKVMCAVLSSESICQPLNQRLRNWFVAKEVLHIWNLNRYSDALRLK